MAIPFAMPSIDPRDQIRQRLAGEFKRPVAELLLKWAKANPSFTLADLSDDEERAVFIAVALELFSPENLADVTMCVNAQRRQSIAEASAEDRAIADQARQDVVTFGDRLLQAFMTTSPRVCPLCREVLITNAVDVLLTPSGQVKGRAHGLCCAKNPARFAGVNEFTYRLLEVR